MIHIVVPSTTTLVERSDGVTKYTAFNIHINGWLHASIRFSLLHKFAETVRLKFGGKYAIPEFPPKKLAFSRLEGAALDERRLRIAKYLQSLVQLTDVIRSNVVERQFLEFQLESYRPASSSVTLEILLGDGTRHSTRCGVLLNTRDVLKVVAENLACDFDLLTQYFGLFMVRERREDGKGPFDMLPVRLLRNFESPYVSLQLANQRSAGRIVYKLQLRRMVWEPRVQEKLFDCAVVTKLLFKQAAAELDCGQILPPNKEIIDQLDALKNEASAERFLRLCSQQSTYGYEELGIAEAELPSKGTKRTRLRVGRRQLLLICMTSGTEWIFRATRIRIWRISQPSSVADPLIFQFEYLVGKDHFEWVTLHTDQAILLSLLLQSIGADILSEHHEAAKEAARTALSETEVISPLKIPASMQSSTSTSSYGASNYNGYSSATLVLPSGVNILPPSLSEEGTSNSSFALEITDDDL